MARRRQRKPKTEPDEVTAESGDVLVRYAGYRVPPEEPPPRKCWHCPLCGWGPATTADRYAASETAYFLQCQRCVDRTTGRPARWKEPR